MLKTGLMRYRKNKYGNYKVGGCDSKKEFRRKRELTLLQAAGEIKNLEEQKSFVLQEGFQAQSGKKLRPITYIVDFYYFDCAKNCWVAEDVKGFKTDVYKIKAKLFQFRYPEITFLET